MNAAAWHAVESGAPLNRFITVNWSSAGVENARAATAGFLKLAGDWLSAQGVRRAYIWVRENNGGDHVHILIHVPNSLAHAFSRRQRGWLKALGAETRRGVIMTVPIARDYSAAETSPAYYRHNLDHVIRYLLKGAAEEAAHLTDHQRRPAGLVSGQRAGVSHDLGKRAREVRALGHSPASPGRSRSRTHARTHARTHD